MQQLARKGFLLLLLGASTAHAFVSQPLIVVDYSERTRFILKYRSEGEHLDTIDIPKEFRKEFLPNIATHTSPTIKTPTPKLVDVGDTTGGDTVSNSHVGI